MVLVHVKAQEEEQFNLCMHGQVRCIHNLVVERGRLMSQSPSSSSSGAGGGTVGDEGEKIALAITTAYGTKNVSEVNCIDIFDRLWYCGTPMNQLDAFYKVRPSCYHTSSQ